jgi:hypothetical protein
MCVMSLRSIASVHRKLSPRQRRMFDDSDVRCEAVLGANFSLSWLALTVPLDLLPLLMKVE